MIETYEWLHHTPHRDHTLSNFLAPVPSTAEYIQNYELSTLFDIFTEDNKYIRSLQTCFIGAWILCLLLTFILVCFLPTFLACHQKHKRRVTAPDNVRFENRFGSQQSIIGNIQNDDRYIGLSGSNNNNNNRDNEDNISMTRSELDNKHKKRLRIYFAMTVLIAGSAVGLIVWACELVISEMVDIGELVDDSMSQIQTKIYIAQANMTAPLYVTENDLLYLESATENLENKIDYVSTFVDISHYNETEMLIIWQELSLYNELKLLNLTLTDELLNGLEYYGLVKLDTALIENIISLNESINSLNAWFDYNDKYSQYSKNGSYYANANGGTKSTKHLSIMVISWGVAVSVTFALLLICQSAIIYKRSWNARIWQPRELAQIISSSASAVWSKLTSRRTSFHNGRMGSPAPVLPSKTIQLQNTGTSSSEYYNPFDMKTKSLKYQPFGQDDLKSTLLGNNNTSNDSLAEYQKIQQGININETPNENNSQSGNNNKNNKNKNGQKCLLCCNWQPKLGHCISFLLLIDVIIYVGIICYQFGTSIYLSDICDDSFDFLIKIYSTQNNINISQGSPYYYEQQLMEYYLFCNNSKDYVGCNSDQQCLLINQIIDTANTIDHDKKLTEKILDDIETLSIIPNNYWSNDTFLDFNGTLYYFLRYIFLPNLNDLEKVVLTWESYLNCTYFELDVTWNEFNDQTCVNFVNDWFLSYVLQSIVIIVVFQLFRVYTNFIRAQYDDKYVPLFYDVYHYFECGDKCCKCCK